MGQHRIDGSQNTRTGITSVVVAVTNSSVNRPAAPASSGPAAKDDHGMGASFTSMPSSAAGEGRVDGGGEEVQRVRETTSREDGEEATHCPKLRRRTAYNRREGEQTGRSSTR